MSKYRLNINFKDEDLKVIAKAHQKVILVKHTARDKDSSVASVSFKRNIMSEYRLNINFTEKDLKATAKAHQKEELVKHTAGGKDSSIAWVSFRTRMNNTVDWENRFAIYASNSEMQSQAAISKLSDKMATPGIMYEF